MKVIDNEALYKPEYKDITHRYFEIRYKQNENENSEEYFKRILTKKLYESFEIYVRRIKYLQTLFPDLKCWRAFEFVRVSNIGYRLKILLVSENIYIIYVFILNVFCNSVCRHLIKE